MTTFHILTVATGTHGHEVDVLGPIPLAHDARSSPGMVPRTTN